MILIPTQMARAEEPQPPTTETTTVVDTGLTPTTDPATSTQDDSSSDPADTGTPVSTEPDSSTTPDPDLLPPDETPPDEDPPTPGDPDLDDPALGIAEDASLAPAEDADAGLDPLLITAAELEANSATDDPAGLVPAEPEVGIGSSDPYFTRGGTLYSFTAADCNPYTAGDQPCASPIQAALDDIKANGFPTDGTLYVDGGTYSDTITIDGFSDPLTISGSANGSDSILTGTVTVSNSTGAISLDQFDFQNDIIIIDVPTLTLGGTAGDNLFDVLIQGAAPIALTVNGGAGNDSLTITGDAANNVLNLSVSEVETVAVNTGLGDDKVIITQANLTTGTQVLSVDGGDGSDTLELHAVVSGIHNIETLGVMGWFELANTFDGDVRLDKKTDQTIVLADGSQVQADLQTLVFHNVDFLIGYAGIGLQLTGVDLVIAWWTEKVAAGETARKWTTVLGDIGGVSFLTVPGLTLSVNSVAVQANKPATDGSLVDYVQGSGETRATNLTVTLAPGHTLTFAIDDTLGDFVRVGGNATIDLFGLATLTADFSVAMQGEQDIYLSDNNATAVKASLLTVGLANLSLFVGYSGIGLQMTNVNLAMAFWTEKVAEGATPRKWTSVMESGGTVTFLEPLDRLDLTVSNVTLQVNKAATDGTVVDYLVGDGETNKTNLTVNLGSGTPVEFKIDDEKGDFVQVLGNVSINLFDFVTIAGAFGVENGGEQKIYVSGSEAPVTASLLTVGLANLSLFVGYSGIGLQLSNVNLALAFWTEKVAAGETPRQWTSVMESGGTATFLEPLDSLTLDVSGVTLQINKPASDGTVMDYHSDGPTDKATALTVNVGSGAPVVFDIDDANGDFMRVLGTVNINLFDFVTVSGGFGVEKKGEQDLYISGTETAVKANLLTMGLANLALFVGYSGIGLQLTDLDLALAFWTEKVADGETPRQWTSVMGSIGDATFLEPLDGLTLDVTTASLQVNKPATDGTVVDYHSEGATDKATALTVNVGPGETVAFDIDDKNGDFVRVLGNVNINLFNFVTVSGAFGVEKKGEQDIYLSNNNATAVTANLLTVGLANLALFVGYDPTGNLADKIGLSLTGVDLALAFWTEKVAAGETPRQWLSVMGNVTDATFLEPLDRLTLDVSGVTLQMNKPASDGTLVDYVAGDGQTNKTDLTANVGPGKTVEFTIDAAYGDFMRVLGNVSINLFDFVTIAGGFGVEKKGEQEIFVSGSETAVTASLLTVGLANLALFVGYSGIGLQLTDLDLALAFWTEKVAAGETPRKWMSVMGAVADATFLEPIDRLTLDVSNVSLQVNKPATDGTVVDYHSDDAADKATVLTVNIGPADTVAFDIDDKNGDFVRVLGNVDIDLLGFVTVSGGFGVEKKGEQEIYLSNSNTTAVTANLLTVGLANLSLFVGYDPTGNLADKIGLQLTDLDLALAFWTEKVAAGETPRQWLSVMGSVATATFLEPLDRLTLDVTNVSLQVNKAATDGTVVDYVVGDGETNKTDLTANVGPGETVEFKIDDENGDFIRVLGNVSINLFDFVTVSGAFGVEKKGDQDIYLSGSETAVKANLLTVGLANLALFVGYSGIGLQLTDLDLALAFWSEQVAAGETPRSWLSVMGSVADATFLEPLDELTLDVSGVTLQVNKAATDGTVVDYHSDDAADKSTSLTVNVGPGETVAFDIDDKNGDFVRVLGHVDIDLFGLVNISGGFGVEMKSNQSIVLSNNDPVTANLLTVGLAGVTAFMGYNGIGLSLTAVDLAMAFWKEVGGAARSWVSVMGSVGAIEFIGLDILTLEALNINILVNTAVGGLVVDYEKTDLTAFIGRRLNTTSGAWEDVTRKFSMGGVLYEIIRVTIGSATLGVDGLFYLTGAFAFEKSSFQVDVVTGLSNTPRLEDVLMDAILLGGSDVSISVGGKPDEALFTIEHISFALGLFFSSMLVETRRMPTLYALKASLAFAPALDLDLVVLRIGLEAINFRLNGGLAWPNSGISPYIDFTGGPVTVQTGGTPVILDFNTAVIGVELVNPVLNLADFVVVTATSLLIEHRTAQVNVMTGLTASTVGSAASGLNQIRNATVSSDYSQITNLRVNINVLAAQNVHIYIGGTTEAEALISIGPISFGLAIVSSTRSYDPGRAVPTMVALRANWLDPLNIDYEGLTIQLGKLVVKVNWGSAWPTGLPAPPAPYVDWTTSPSFAAAGGMNLTLDGTLKADFDHGLIRVEADKALVSLFDFFYFRFDTFFIEKGTGWQVDGFTGLNLLTATQLGLATKLASYVSADYTTFTDLAVDSLLLGGTGIQLFAGLGPYFDADGNPLSTSEAVGFVITGLDFGLAIIRDRAKVFPTMFTLKGIATGVSVVGLDFLTLSFDEIDLALNLGSKWDAGYDYRPAINWAGSFPADGGYQITTTIKFDFNSPAIKVAIQNGRIRLLDVLYLQGNFAFEKGAQYTVVVKDDTGLIPATCPGINCLLVDALTLGGRDITAFFGVGSLDADGNVVDGSTGLAIQHLSFGLGIFKPVVPLPALGDKAVFIALNASVAMAGFVGLEDIATIDVWDVILQLNTLIVNLGGPKPLPIYIDFKASFETAPGAHDGVFNITTGAGSTLPMVIDYDTWRIRASIGFFEMKVGEYIYLAGSMALNIGSQVTVKLNDADASSLEVMVMTLAASGVYGFIGMDGPYWEDTNDDHKIDASDTPNTSAIGLTLENLNVAMAIMVAVPFTKLQVFLALKATLDKLALIGIPGLTAQTTGLLVALNLSAGVLFPPNVVVDFPTSFPAEPAGEDPDGDGLLGEPAGYQVDTGAAPFYINFSGFLIEAQGTVDLVILNSLTIHGFFHITIDSDGFDFDVNGTMAIAPLGSLTVITSLHITRDGLVASLAISAGTDPQVLQAAGIRISAIFRLEINTTGADATIPHMIIDSTGNYAGIDPNYLLPANTVRLSVVGDFEIIGYVTIHGYFDLVVNPSGLAVHFDAYLSLGLFGTIAVKGDALLHKSPDYFVMYADVTLQFSLAVINLNGSFHLEINTHTDPVCVGGTDPGCVGGHVVTPVFMLRGIASLSVLSLRLADCDITISYQSGLFRAALNNLTLDFFHFVTISISGFIQSDGQYEIYGWAHVGTNLGIVAFNANLLVHVWNCEVGICIPHTTVPTSYPWTWVEQVSGTGVSIQMWGGVTINLGIASAGASIAASGTLTEVYAHISFSVSLRITLGWCPFCVSFSVGFTWDKYWSLGPDPILAEWENGDPATTVVYLNVGDRADRRGDLYKDIVEENYYIQPYGTNGISVLSMGVQLDFPNVTLIQADFGAGRDQLVVAAGVKADLVVYGGDGNDVITYLGDGTATIYGGAGDDVLSGGAGVTTLSGEDGNDVLWAGDGGGNLLGGSGNDVLYGGSSSDILFGGAGNDSLYGGPGNDLLSGDAGYDVLKGGDGNDSLFDDGAGAYLTVKDKDGNDIQVPVAMCGEACGEVVLDQDGNPIAMTGDDTLTITGDASHVLNLSSVTDVGGSLFNMLVNGDAGNDTLSVDDSGDTLGRTVILSATTLMGLGMNPIGVLSYTGVEALNILFGSGADNVIVQGTHAGGTTLTTGAGSDAVMLQGQGGAVTVNAGLGMDLVTVDGIGGTVVLNGQEDADSFFIQSTLASSNLTVNGGNGNDQVTIFGMAGASTLNGEAGDDTFFLANPVAVSASLNGGTGLDRVDYSLYGSPVSVTLSAVAVDGFSGTGSGLTGSFSLIDVLFGSPFVDTFTGLAIDSRFVLHAVEPDYYVAGGQTLHLYAFENYRGSGGGASSLDFSDFGAPARVTLIALDPDGFSVTIAGKSGIFGNINTLIGSPFIDSITGMNLAATFEIHAADPDLYLCSGRTMRLFAFEDYIGGTGLDTLDYSLFGSGASADLFTGLASGVGGVVAGIENLVGSPYNDQLTGNDGANLITGGAGDDALNGMGGDDLYLFGSGWGSDTLLDGAGQDTLDFSSLLVPLVVDLGSGSLADPTTNTLSFSGVDVIETGAGADEFHISGTQNCDLYSGGGADRFVFGAGAAMGGWIDAGAGLDVLDYGGFVTPLGFQLSGLNADGFSGGESGASVDGFAGIDTIVGGSAQDTLAGLDQQTVITVHAGSFDVAYPAFGQTLWTSSIENMLSGIGDDSFLFDDGATIGSLDGGLGTDGIDLGAYTSPLNLLLTGLGSLDGFSGSGIGAFTNINVLHGGAAGDTLTGMNAAATFMLDGSDQYLSGGRSLDIPGFETLVGGSGADLFDISGNRIYDLLGGLGNDTFRFGDGAVLDGSLDGQGGSNTLDFSLSTVPVDVSLLGPGSLVGFAGIVPVNLSGAFDNIGTLLGGSALDTLSGPDLPSVWNVIDGNVGTYTSGGVWFSFNGFETLFGGGAQDSFVFANGAWLDGSVSGGGGMDGLNLLQFTDDLLVDLNQGVALDLTTGLPVIGGGISGIVNVFTGSGNDHLIGDAQNNRLWGGAGNDVIEGGPGNDVIRGGSGYNWLYGDAGNDIFIVIAGGNRVFGGDGVDTVMAHIRDATTNRWNSIEVFLFEYDSITPVPRWIPIILVEDAIPVGIEYPSGVILRLENGDQVYFAPGVGTSASLAHILVNDLPAPLPLDLGLVQAMQVLVWNGSVPVEWLLSPSLVSFVIPAWLVDLEFTILYWKETTGEWVEVPSYRTRYPSGEEMVERQAAWVDRTGLYVLAVRGLPGSLNCLDTLTLELPNGDRILVPCGSGDLALLRPELSWNLPELPQGAAFLSAVTALVSRNGQSLDPAALTLSFAIPAHDANTRLAVLHLEAGGWVEVPGASTVGDRIQVSVDGPGTYVLVNRPLP